MENIFYTPAAYISDLFLSNFALALVVVLVLGLILLLILGIPYIMSEVK